MAETARARAWLYTTLTGDPTLQELIGRRVYHGRAPTDAQYPFVVFQVLSPGNDLVAVGGIRVWSAPLFLIKAVGKGGGTGPLEPIVNRIDQLLHVGSGSVTNGVIEECVRERPHDLPEVSDGVQFQNLGGEYRIRVRQA